jgi:hypothetical protein
MGAIRHGGRNRVRLDARADRAIRVVFGSALDAIETGGLRHVGDGTV